MQSRVTKRRAERNEQRGSESRTSTASTGQGAAAFTPSVPRPVDVAVEIYCVPQLFSDYSSNSGIAIYDALPALASASPASCYSHALDSVAVASSSGRLYQPGLLTRARVSYGTAMSNLQRAIMEPEPLRDDSVLVTLFLLGFFEVGCALSTPCVVSCKPVAASTALTPPVFRVSDSRRSSPRRFPTPG